VDGQAAFRDDYVRPFRLGQTQVRGRLVRLGAELARLLDRHAYPDAAAETLGESLAIAAALSHALKAEGVFTLQVEGSGPVGRLVADIDASGLMRGFAGFEDGAWPEEARRAPFGAGYLALTFDPADGAERYQGVVELTEGGLAGCVRHYFRQSEQIDTCLAAACGRRGGAWRAAALMLQRLPEQAGPETGIEAGEPDELWTRLGHYMQTVGPGELLDPALPGDALLLRLFHRDALRVDPPRRLRDGCRCGGRARMEAVLRAFSAEDMADMRREDGSVEMVCRFCGRAEAFSAEQTAVLAGAAGISGAQPA